MSAGTGVEREGRRIRTRSGTRGEKGGSGRGGGGGEEGQRDGSLGEATAANASPSANGEAPSCRSSRPVEGCICPSVRRTASAGTGMDRAGGRTEGDEGGGRAQSSRATGARGGEQYEEQWTAFAVILRCCGPRSELPHDLGRGRSRELGGEEYKDQQPTAFTAILRCWRTREQLGWRTLKLGGEEASFGWRWHPAALVLLPMCKQLGWFGSRGAQLGAQRARRTKNSGRPRSHRSPSA
ncbi:hypothetical protein DFH09DRAFT_1162494 [Mycena vulgaris]|nr:hypothetical protein DFH09DRAFT_1162494 [Mycena vulgaris]